MNSFSFRISSPGWLTVLVTLLYVGAIIAWIILDFSTYRNLTLGSRGATAALLVFLLAPLFGILFLMSRKRELHIGQGQLVVTDGRSELQRFMLRDIGQVSITTQRRHLTFYDRMGNQIAVFKPYIGAKHAERAVDFLRTQLPHFENQQQVGRGQNIVTNRHIVFPG